MMNEAQYTKYKEKFMSQIEPKTQLPLIDELVRIVSGADLESLVNATFVKRKPWAFCMQTTPVFVPSVLREPHQISEDAVETWLSGMNGKHYHVSSTSLIRHLCAKGLIPEGNYLILADPNLYVYMNRLSALSDESTVEGPKGVC